MRRCTRAAWSKRLQRLRSERVEGALPTCVKLAVARRSWLCGIEKVQLTTIAAVARNLGRITCKLFGDRDAEGL